MKKTAEFREQLTWENVCLEERRHLVSVFFHNRQHLFKFPEVLEDHYASLGYRVNKTAFSNAFFFDQTLFNQEGHILFQHAAVNIGFVHYMR